MKNMEKVYDSMFCNYPDVVNLKQMMVMLGDISSTLAYKILRENKIQSKKVGREYRIPKINVISYVIHDK